MSLDQYNQLMSNMLNERCAFTKLRTELEGKERKLYRHCGKFGYIVQKCKSGKKETKKTNPQNKFEVLKS